MINLILCKFPLFSPETKFNRGYNTTSVSHNFRLHVISRKVKFQPWTSDFKKGIWFHLHAKNINLLGLLPFDFFKRDWPPKSPYYFYIFCCYNDFTILTYAFKLPNHGRQRRQGTVSTKNGHKTTPCSPTKHGKNSQLHPYQTKLFWVPPFAILLQFSRGCPPF